MQHRDTPNEGVGIEVRQQGVLESRTRLKALDTEFERISPIQFDSHALLQSFRLQCIILILTKQAEIGNPFPNKSKGI